MYFGIDITTRPCIDNALNHILHGYASSGYFVTPRADDNHAAHLNPFATQTFAPQSHLIYKKPYSYLPDTDNDRSVRDTTAKNAHLCKLGSQSNLTKIITYFRTVN